MNKSEFIDQQAGQIERLKAEMKTMYSQVELGDLEREIEGKVKANWNPRSPIATGHISGCICQVCINYYKYTCGLLDTSDVRSCFAKLREKQ